MVEVKMLRYIAKDVLEEEEDRGKYVHTKKSNLGMGLREMPLYKKNSIIA